MGWPGRAVVLSKTSEGGEAAGRDQPQRPPSPRSLARPDRRGLGDCTVALGL
jgi:hypothetical protein